MLATRLSLAVFLAAVWIGVAGTAICAQELPAAPLELPYLLRLADRVASWRKQLPDMDDSANQAAEGTIAGGNLYVFGPQPSFVSEAVCRAGGLMLTRPYTSDVTLTSRDTVLAAQIGSEDEAEHDALRGLIAQAGKVGAQVVLFGAANATSRQEVTIVALPRDQEFSDVRDIASVSNVVGMWAWTGHFIAACTRQNRMPCVYQSHILPDGRQRTAHLEKFDGGRFHVATSVRPQDTERIAESYLITIEKALRHIFADERPALEHAASLIRASRDRGYTVPIYTLGHMYLGEFEQPQQPDWLVHVDALKPTVKVDTAIVLYYISFPWEIVDKIHKANQACIVVSSEEALADFKAKPGNVYINPHWSIYDAAVDLPNYDVRLLPASGVLNTAVYWQLVEWANAEPERIGAIRAIPH